VTNTEAKTTLSVTIDGEVFEARPGELLIEACERAGTYIPRFCYHSRMKPVGMCRMCLVEVDTGRGPALQPACMLPCSDGMTVSTETPGTRKVQAGILEYLLINHPLDCPVCDKGGECPLQDQTVAYGPGESRFVEEKRHYEKPIPINDNVFLDRERCILCDRCTRFADTVAGDKLIHFMDRGNNTQVNTFPDEPFASYFSGNTVQICPVGALTARPYRFKARPWDLDETVSTAWTDSAGARVAVQSSRDKVIRLLGIDSDPVNWGWLSDKERFAFEALNSDDRLTAPLTRVGDHLVPTGWSTALERAVSLLSDADPDRVAVIGGARLTNESQYAWAKLAKGVIGTDNVDSQLADGLDPELVLGLPRATIDEACTPGGTIILCGPDPKEEIGSLYLRLRHAVVHDDARLIELTPTATGLSPVAAHSLHPRPGEVADLARALVEAANGGPAVSAAGVSAEEISSAAVAIDGSVTIIIGRASLAESADCVTDAALQLAALPGSRFLSALRRGNIHGALDSGLAPGLLPGRTTIEAGAARFADAWPSTPASRGLDTAGILAAAADGRIDVLVLLGSDPINDFAGRPLAAAALETVPNVIALDMLVNDSIAMAADVVLAASGATESAGTFTNLEGRISVCRQRVTPPGTARADWMIASEIARRLGFDLGFDSVESIRAEIAAVSVVHSGLDEKALAEALVDGLLIGGSGDIMVPGVVGVSPSAHDAYSLRLVASRSMYDDGVALRNSPSSRGLARSVTLRLNPTDFDKIGVDRGTVVRTESAVGRLLVPVEPDPGVPVGSAVLPWAAPGSPANTLIDPFSTVTDVRVERA